VCWVCSLTYIRRICVRLSPSIHFVDSLSAASREAFDTFQTKHRGFGSIEISAAPGGEKAFLICEKIKDKCEKSYQGSYKTYDRREKNDGGSLLNNDGGEKELSGHFIE
jgi:hypothetical protein